MNYKQLKIFAMCCMVFDHAVRIFPLGRYSRLWQTFCGARGTGASPTGCWRSARYI